MALDSPPKKQRKMRIIGITIAGQYFCRQLETRFWLHPLRGARKLSSHGGGRLAPRHFDEQGGYVCRNRWFIAKQANAPGADFRVWMFEKALSRIVV
jgi:hypothetical protein